MQQKKILFFILLYIFSTCHICSQSLSDSTIAKINRIFSKWDSKNTPGCVVGIIKNDSLIFTKGYGMANLEYNISNTPNTVYHMASVSKQFTAYCIVLLAKQGKLNLDDDIHTYLPWFPDLKEKITIRHLLNHTSGIRDQWALVYISGTSEEDVITQEHVVKILSKQQALNFKPNDDFSYSNSGYTLLAEIIKSVSGKSLRAFSDSAIFKPLQMSNTFFHDDYTEIIKNRASSYSRNDSTHFSNFLINYSTVGATGLYTTMNDISKWIQNFYAIKVGDKTTIQLLTDSKPTLANDKPSNYAFGIRNRQYHGKLLYEHGGVDAGYRTVVYIFPTEKMGFVIFGNLEDIPAFPKADELADLFIPDKNAHTKHSDEKIDSSKAILKDPIYYSKYSGDYISELGDLYKIFVYKSKLYLSSEGENYLLQEKKGDFIPVTEPMFKFSFEATKTNDTLLHQYWPKNHRILYKAKGSNFHSDEDLKKYTGTYYSPELDCWYGIILKDHSLEFTNNKYDNSKAELIGTEDLFDENLLGHIKVTRDQNNQINGFEINMDRIRHLKFNKIE